MRHLWHCAKDGVGAAFGGIGAAFGAALAALLSLLPLAAVVVLVAVIGGGGVATAQQSGASTVIFSVQPETEARVSIITEGDNAGYLSFIGTTPATITASVMGVSGTYNPADNPAFTPASTLQALTFTIRALPSCNISEGCDNAFGLTGGNAAARLHTFVTAGLSTMSMYIAAGAEVNDRVRAGGGEGVSLFLLYHLATAAMTTKMSIIAAAGASVNATTENGWTPLFWLLTVGGNVAGVESLLSIGASATHKDTDNRTALHIAAASGGGDLISVMARAGVSLEAVDNDNWTALFAAANTGGGIAVSALLSLGANVNSRDGQSRTPLHLAGLSNQSGAVRGLAAVSSVDINASDNAGWTPLHFAAAGGSNIDNAAMNALITAGAAVNRRTNRGLSPWDIARQNNVNVAALVANGGGCSQSCSSETPALPIIAAVNISTEAAFGESATVGVLDISGGYLLHDLIYGFRVLPPYNEGAVEVGVIMATLAARDISNPGASLTASVTIGLPRYPVIANLAGGQSRLNTISIIIGDFCGVAGPGETRGGPVNTCAAQITASMTITAAALRFDADVSGDDELHNVAPGRFAIVGTVSAASSSPDIFGFAMDTSHFRGTIITREDSGEDGDSFYVVAAPGNDGTSHSVVITINGNTDIYDAPTTVTFSALASSSDEVLLIGGGPGGAVWASPANSLRAGSWAARGVGQDEFRNLTGHRVVNYNGTVVVIGGRGTFNGVASNGGVSWSSDRGQTWTHYTPPFSGGSRPDVGVTFHRGALYVVAGSHLDDNLWRVADVRSAAGWQRITSPPDNRLIVNFRPLVAVHRGTLAILGDNSTFNYDTARRAGYYLDDNNGTWTQLAFPVGTPPLQYVGAALLELPNGRVMIYGARVSHAGEGEGYNIHRYAYYLHQDEHIHDGWQWFLCANQSTDGINADARPLFFRGSVYIFDGDHPQGQITRLPADGCPASSPTSDGLQTIPQAAQVRGMQAVYVSDARPLQNVPLPVPEGELRAIIPDVIPIPQGAHYRNEILFAPGVENPQPGSSYDFDLQAKGDTGLAIDASGNILFNRNLGLGNGIRGPRTATLQINESGNIFDTSGRGDEQPFTVEVVENVNVRFNFRRNLNSVALIRNQWLRLTATAVGGFAFRGYTYGLSVSAHANLDARFYIPDNRLLAITTTSPAATTYYRRADLYIRAGDGYPSGFVNITATLDSLSPAWAGRDGIGREVTVINLPVVGVMSITTRTTAQTTLTAAVANARVFVVDGLDGFVPTGAGYLYSINSAVEEFAVSADDFGEGIVSLTAPLTNDDAGTHVLTVIVADHNTPPARATVLLTAVVIMLEDFAANINLQSGVLPLVPESSFAIGAGFRGTISASGGIPPYSYSSSSGNVRFANAAVSIFTIEPNRANNRGNINDAFTLTTTISVSDAAAGTPDFGFVLTITAAPQVLLRQVNIGQSGNIPAGVSSALGGFRAHQASGRDYLNTGEVFVLPEGAALTLIPGGILSISAGAAEHNGTPYSVIIRPPLAGVHIVVATISVANALFIPALLTTTLTINPAAGASGAEVFVFGGRTHWSTDGNSDVLAGDIDDIGNLTVRARNIIPSQYRVNFPIYGAAYNGTLVVFRNDAADGKRVFWSPDAGYNWYSYIPPFPPRAALVTNRGALYAIGGRTTADNRVWRSTDSINWQRVQQSSDNNERLNATNSGVMDYHQAVSFQSSIITPGVGNVPIYESATGEQWRAIPRPSSGYPPSSPILARYELINHNGNLVLFGAFGARDTDAPAKVYHSADGATWQQCANDLPIDYNNNLWTYISGFSYRGTAFVFGGIEANSAPNNQIQRWSGTTCPDNITRFPLPNNARGAMRAVLLDSSTRPVYGDDFPLPQARLSVIGSLTIAADATLALSLSFFGGAAPYTLSADNTQVSISVISGINADLHLALPQSGSQTRAIAMTINHGGSINRQIQTTRTLTITIRRE